MVTVIRPSFAFVGATTFTLAAVMEPVRVHYLWRPRLRDADDDMVLEVAVNGRADAIVTFNLRDFGAVPAGFGIELLRPAEAMRRLIG